jgi:hypothetical protein
MPDEVPQFENQGTRAGLLIDPQHDQSFACRRCTQPVASACSCHIHGSWFINPRDFEPSILSSFSRDDISRNVDVGDDSESSRRCDARASYNFARFPA